MAKKKKKAKTHCDQCLSEIQGKKYTITNENFALQRGVYYCEHCYAQYIGATND